MSSSINKKEFTEVGELILHEDGVAIKLLFGKTLKRLLKHLLGQRLEVGFKPLSYQRTDRQNKWLWGVAYVTIAAWYRETQGHRVDKDALHAHTLQYILDYKITAKEVLGREVLVVEGKSTSQLNTKEFNEMKEKLQAYWAERGCDIPDPKGNNFLSDYISDE